MRQEPLVRIWSLVLGGMTLTLAHLFHPIAYVMLPRGETAAWLATFLSGLVALILFLPTARFMSRHPGLDLVGLGRMAAGEPGAILTGVAVALICLPQIGLVIRQTVEMAVSSVYPHTPETFATVALTICFVAGAFGRVSDLVRLCQSFFPVTLIAVLVLVGGSFAWGRMRYLLPFWGPGPLPVLKSGGFLAAEFGLPLLCVLNAAPFLENSRQLALGSVVLLLGSTVLYAATAVVYLMTFPLPFGYSLTFGLHEMARLVIGGRFLERLEGIWLFVWFYATASYLAAVLQTAAVAWSRAFHLRGHRLALPALVSFSLIIAMMPPDQGRAIAWHETVMPYELAVGLGLPLLLTLMAIVRERLSRKAVGCDS